MNKAELYAQTGSQAGAWEPEDGFFVARAFLTLIIRAFEPPPHAPATAAGAPFTEELFEVGPALFGKGMAFHLHPFPP